MLKVNSELQSQLYFLIDNIWGIERKLSRPISPNKKSCLEYNRDKVLERLSDIVSR